MSVFILPAPGASAARGAPDLTDEELERLTRYVDSTNTAANPDGTEANPFLSIQDAIDDLVALGDETVGQRTVRVVGGRTYDEALDIPSDDAGVWVFIASVFCFVGTFGAPKGFTRTADPANKITGVNPAANFLTEGPGAWIITGNAVLDDVGAGQDQAFSIIGGLGGDSALLSIGEAFAIDGEGMTGDLFVACTRAQISQRISGPTTDILDGDRNTFGASISVRKVEAQSHSSFSNAVTVSAVGSGYLTDCQLASNWGGPAGSFKVDHATLGAFGGSLTGGATVVLLDPHGDKHLDGTDDIAAFVGDSGSGGTKGIVPAPAAGDAALGRVLGAGGGWSQQGAYSTSGKPAEANDNTQGFFPGALWYRTANNTLYVCISAATGAAVWQFVATVSTGAAAPTSTDDNTKGFNQGSIWLESTNNIAYACADPSTGAAVWIKLAKDVDQVVDVVIGATGGAGGDPNGTLTIDVKDLNGNAVAKQCVVLVHASDSQYAGPLDPTATITHQGDTKGALLFKDDVGGRWVFQTDSNGQGEYSIRNTADTTVWFAATDAPGGVPAVGQGVAVRGCVPDSATWS